MRRTAFVRLTILTAICIVAVFTGGRAASAAPASTASGSADVLIAGMSFPSPVTVGDEFDLIVVFFNGGPDTETNETVVTTLPPELTYEYGNEGCSSAGQVVTCDDTYSNLPPSYGSSWALHVKATSAGVGKISAHVYADQTDPNPSNNDYSATIVVDVPLCTPGSWSSTGAQPCTPASPGNYVPSTGATSQMPSPPGSYVSSSGASSPTPCAEGTYTPLTGQTSCSLAPAGSYVGGTGATASTLCAEGTFSSSAGQSACTSAPPGSFVSGTGATDPTSCAPGRYQPASGQTQCIPAEPNYYVPNAGASTETPCPTGTYQPLAGQTSCIADTSPPVFTQHADITGVEATGPSGAEVDYTVVAHDSNNADSVLTVVCAPASGSTFAIGTTTVTCNAQDPAGNAATPMSFDVTVVDTTPPSMPTLPDISDVTHTPGGSVTETFGPYTATDLVDGSVPVQCSPSSGSAFPIGVTTVDCTATDAHGNVAHGSFTVTITYVDTTPPVLAQHADITGVEAAGPSGSAVDYTVTATDPDDAASALTIDCSPAAGSTFALGTTTVTCNAHDPAGNDATPMSFDVTVVDTTPPTMPSLPDISDVTHTPGGTVTETYGPFTATDLVDGSVPVTCSAASGSSFAVGTTTVDCTATDAHGNVGHGSFTVTITYVDTTPPVFEPQADVTVSATGPAGATLSFTVVAHDSDDADSAVTVTCAPASGSTFAIGTTTVTCNAHDPAGNNAAPLTFTVTVLGASDQLHQLLLLVDGLGPGKSLPAKVRAIIADVAAGNTRAAINDLTAFINEVNGQSGKSLTQAQAAQLVAAAQQIQRVLA